MKLIKLIDLCVTEYQQEPDYRDLITGAEFTIISDIETRTLVVCFNGSDDLQDWQTNFDFLGFAPGKVKVHPGFAKAYKNLRKPLLRRLEIYMNISKIDYKYIKVCGHSAGGAIGAIAATELTKEFTDKKVSLFTFGSPVVGNKEYAQLCDRNIVHYRFYNIFDLVTYLPPCLFGYSHSGTGYPLTWLGTLYNLHSIKNYAHHIKKSTLAKTFFYD